MKKLLNKIRRKQDSTPSRITTDTIEQHREEILAGGRKFKYPVQYAKHRLVINAILISLATLVVAAIVGWWQLYPEQNTSDFMYRITTVMPLPVAVVDGQPVLYSDYLMSYRSSVFFAEKYQQLDTKTEDGKRQLLYFKQQSMNDIIADTYAVKLAKSLDVTLSDAELNASLKQQKVVGGVVTSQQTFDASVSDTLNLSPTEYRHKEYLALLKQKVEYKLDTQSLKNINNFSVFLGASKSKSLSNVKDAYNKKSGTSLDYGTSGFVSSTNADGGLAIAASKLKVGQTSGVIQSALGDGYYIVKLLSIKDEKVSYEYVRSSLTAFDNALKKLYADHEVQKFISIPDPTN